MTLDTLREHWGTLCRLLLAGWLLLLVMIEMVSGPDIRTDPISVVSPPKVEGEKPQPVTVVTTPEVVAPEVVDEESQPIDQSERDCLMIEGVQICD